MSALWQGLVQGTSLVRRLVVLVVLSAVSGVLLAGLALPLAGAAGFAARTGAQQFEDLPSDFTVSTPPASTTMYADDGKTLIAKFFTQDRQIVPYAKISPWMWKAQVSIEDNRFFEHGGADLRGMLRALVNNASGGGTQGASTLEQQYVKLALVYAAQQRGDDKAEQAATAETVDRKLRELRLAITLDNTQSKQQILTSYLNIAYYGAGAYGVQAAAQRYFRVNAVDLSITQAALLAGLVQRPNATDPIKHPAAAEARRNVVLQSMVPKYLTQAQADRAKKRPVSLDLHQRVPKQECEAAKPEFAWFCDYAKRYFLQDTTFGATLAQRQRRLYTSGLTIVTTLDPTMQEAAQTGMAKWVYPTDQAAGVVTMVEPGTGYVRGIVISKAYGDKNKQDTATKVNLALNHRLSGSIGTQAGSTFKAFVAAYALSHLKELGVGFGYKIYSPAVLKSVKPMKTCVDGKPGYATGYGQNGKFPGNESLSEQGTFDLRTATQNSINTYFIQLQQKVGLCGPATLAQQMGVFRADTPDAEPLQQIQSFTLGTNNIAPLDLAAAYATFPARGKFCPAYPFLKVTDRKGNPFDLTKGKPACKQVLDPEVADAMNYLLRGVVTGGSGRLASIPGQDVAGKTGTTQGRQQAWFMGYTASLVGSATVWDPSPPKGGYRLSGKKIGGTTYGEVRGMNLPAPMWHDTVGAAIEAAKLPDSNFKAPLGRFFLGGSYAPSFTAANGFGGSGCTTTSIKSIGDLTTSCGSGKGSGKGDGKGGSGSDPSPSPGTTSPATPSKPGKGGSGGSTPKPGATGGPNPKPSPGAGR
ncbi:membrane peptidoglycan carboxypeptidase [Motilibacter rhizosphaerae]|uniref:Membrane peptidoglycan carboxypeptidase n=1 Tax=Motilibacter rhizosphaerae TaxID=598652 RepID=A0A4Q7NXY6_9ACTN|nr:transglycosylase domain-containing protein [Motilibacter rhizosphaerae]RZS91798.1 membrane peptidoglycan carboxypeptidase [Motilibacter rhizosphaerae]